MGIAGTGWCPPSQREAGHGSHVGRQEGGCGLGAKVILNCPGKQFWPHPIPFISSEPQRVPPPHAHGAVSNVAGLQGKGRGCRLLQNSLPYDNLWDQK